MDSKVSDLTAATSAAAADLLLLTQGGQSKKITLANLLANLASPLVVNEAGADQDTRVEGDTDANLVFVDASTDKVGHGTATPTEKLDVYGNLAISNGFLRLSQSDQALVGHGALTTASLTTEITTINVDSGAGATLALADGVAGQTKIFIMNTHGSDCVLTPTNLLGFTTITFTAVGSSVTLLFSGGKWCVLGSKSVTIA